MALEAIKALANEMTEPKPAFKTLGSNSPAHAATPHTRTSSQEAFAINDPTYTRLNTKAVQKLDPVQQRIEDADRAAISGDVNIKTSDILRVRAWEIVDKYNHHNKDTEFLALYGVTEDEFKRLVATAYIQLYSHDSTLFTPEIELKAPPGYTAAKESYVTSDGKTAFAVYDQDGEIAYIDKGGMCMINKGGLNSTTRAMVNDDLITPEQKAYINTKLDANGKIVERDAKDADFKLAMVRFDNQYTVLPNQLNMVDRIIADVSHVKGAPVPFSAAPTAIQTDVPAGKQFGEAVAANDAPAVTTKSIMFQTPRAAAPWEQKPLAPTARALNLE